MNQWQYSTVHNSACKVIEEQTLWGQSVCRVWLPNQDAVVRIPRSALRPLNAEYQPEIEADRITYVAAAAKVAEVLETSTSASDGHVLLAPMESNVIPLPHQIHALSRAISGDRVRYLLADEVGLGKTIEAGLIMRELKLRGLVSRTLVVAPKSIAMQWVAEMNTHFNEAFSLVNPGDLEILERLEAGYWKDGGLLDVQEENPWLRFPQAIVTQDAVKPIMKRKGWSKEQLKEYNARRFDRLVQGNWDLIIVDEAHRLGGSTEQVARFKLGQGLAEAAPYLLLLSATPHQGKSDAFQRLMSLLDSMAFPDLDSVTRASVQPYVIRTEKRKAVDAAGKSLFRPRTTQTLGIDLSRHATQESLYGAVTDYVKAGYNKALKNRKPHLGFLMVLLQRIVTSSTHAIACTLERRLNVLENLSAESLRASFIDPEELLEMDGQEQLDTLIEISEKGRAQEISEVQFLLDLARQAEANGPDTKAVALLDLIYELQGQENDDELKLLLFTEFVPTQTMLRDFLETRGIQCVSLNGSMSMDERRMAQREFRDKARVLISTDAGGEGLNLQFCHIIINYDLPWNPMRIEQRIGRVDRIGQEKPVRAYNFAYDGSVENRVREVLESKLQIILSEIGINKTSDVLDSSLAGEMFEQMMTHVIMQDADTDSETEELVERLKKDIEEVREKASPLYGCSDEPDLHTAASLRDHPLPHWVERMTIAFLRMKKCSAEKTLLGWDIQWPDGTVMRNVSFVARELDGDGQLLSLENNRVRGLALNLPEVTAGQPLPRVAVRGVPSSITGLWGLFEIRIQAGMNQKTQVRIPLVRRGYVSVFLSEEGKLFLPTARHIWDALQTEEPQVLDTLGYDESAVAYDRLQKGAEQAGQELFDALQQAHIASISREEERGMVAFASRRKAIERLGLLDVRQYRLARCDADEAEWRNELQSARQIVPEIRPLLLVRITKGSAL
ncbi:MAG: helicase-related protein [Candidatus Sedimenticola sp. PURPLELP]